MGDVIYVAGRDQITRLKELGGTGEADYYENFNNDTLVTENFHEFALDLQTDAQGNFAFTDLIAGNWRIEPYKVGDLGGGVSVLSIDNQTYASIAGTVSAGGDVSVNSSDQSDVLMR